MTTLVSCWIENRYAWESGEVFGVECENVADTMHKHRRNEPRIVRLLARHAMGDNEPPSKSGSRNTECSTLKTRRSA